MSSRFKKEDVPLYATGFHLGQVPVLSCLALENCSELGHTRVMSFTLRFTSLGICTSESGLSHFVNCRLLT